jgi:hypothetical protein
MITSDAYVDQARFGASSVVLSSNETCRDSVDCNIKAMADMFSMAKCTSIVTTYSSTFARCSAGLNGVLPYVVQSNGLFYRQVTSEPVDAGAMAELEIVPFIQQRCSPFKGHFNVKVDLTTRHTANVSWITPDLDASDYQIRINALDDRDSMSITVEESKNWLLLENLKAGTNYGVSIASEQRKSLKVFFRTIEEVGDVCESEELDLGAFLHVRSPVIAGESACLLYLLNSDDKIHLNQLGESLKRLDRFFNIKHGYDVVILHAKTLSVETTKELHEFTLSNLVFVDVTEHMGRDDLLLNERFAAGEMFSLGVFDDYEWFWKLEVHSFLVKDVAADPFVYLKGKDKKLGYLHAYTYEETDMAFKTFLEKNRIEMKNRASINIVYSSRTIIGYLPFFRGKEYQKIIEYLSGLQGFSWDSHKVYAFGMAVYYQDSDLDLSLIIHMKEVHDV